jgi:hypothetical protein
MRLADKILIAASVLSLGWALFVISLIPLGVADSIYHPIREAMLTAHDEDEARSIAGRMGGIAGRNFQSAAWLGFGPLLAVNGSWCVLAGYRLGRIQAKSRASRAEETA